MEKLFGIPMPVLMMVLSGIFLTAMLVVVVMALRNSVMLKMGIRPISRRPGMTALIIIGVMLSTIIMAAAFGTADTLTYSIRDIAVNGLQEIDEVIVPARAAEGDTFGQSFISMDRYRQLQAELAGDDRIDGLMPQYTANVPAVNPAEGLSEGQLNLVGVDPAQLSGFGGLRLAAGGDAAVESLSDRRGVRQRGGRRGARAPGRWRAGAVPGGRLGPVRRRGSAGERESCRHRAHDGDPTGPGPEAVRQAGSDHLHRHIEQGGRALRERPERRGHQGPPRPVRRPGRGRAPEGPADAGRLHRRPGRETGRRRLWTAGRSWTSFSPASRRQT